MWASKALGTNQRVIATICGARSGHRTADFSGDCPKIDTLAAQRSGGVMEPIPYSLVMKMLPCLLTRVIEIA
jgi:hypothetical protein